MNKKQVDERLDQLVDEQTKLGIDFIIQEARKLLGRHSRLKEFVMGVGEWFFIDSKGNIIHEEHLPKYIESSSLYVFMTYWDNDLHFTGVPMRFTKDSEITRDW